MALGKQKKTTEESEAKDIPKLTVSHFKDITKLYKHYGGRNRLLAYWMAVKLDDSRENIVAVYDYREMSDRAMAQYEAFEPLKGIRYMGTGYLTYTPFNWCNEWLAKWEWWCDKNREDPDVKSIMATPEKMESFRKAMKNIGKVATH